MIRRCGRRGAAFIEAARLRSDADVAADDVLPLDCQACTIARPLPEDLPVIRTMRDATRSMLASELHDQERCTKPRGARWLRRYVPNLSPVPTSSRRERRSGYYGRPAAPSASRRGRAASSAAVSGEDGLARTPVA